MKFSGEWPEGIRALVESVFRQGEWLIPSWYSPDKIRIYYEAHDVPQNSMLTARVEHAYKMACIWVYPSFLSEPPEQQLEAVYHEFFHLSVNPTFDLALDILERACGEDSATYKILKAQAVVLLEQSVSDLACALRQHEQTKISLDKREEWPDEDEAPVGWVKKPTFAKCESCQRTFVPDIQIDTECSYCKDGGYSDEEIERMKSGGRTTDSE